MTFGLYSYHANRHKRDGLSSGCGLLSGVGLLAASLLAAGCASMTPEECMHADWRAVGHEDGAAGRGMERLGDHRKACAEVGVTPNFAAYQAGHRAGVRVFCHPANGYSLGRGGYAYTGICPGDLEPAFLEALEEGLFVYELEADVNAAASEVAALDSDMESIVQDIADTEDALEQDDLDEDERRRLREQSRRLSRELGRLEARQREMLAELRWREDRLHTHLGGR